MTMPWPTFALEELASVQRGKFSARPRNDPKYYGGDIPFIQTGDVANGAGRVRSYSQTLNTDGLSVSKLFPRGSLVVTIAANIGDVAKVEFDFACPDSLVVVQANEGVDSDWLQYSLESKKELLDSLAPQNAQKNINLEVLRPLAFDVPPLGEQQRIAGALATWDTAIQKTEQLIAAKERHYSHELSRLISRGQHPHGHVGTFAEEVSARNRGGKWRTVALSDIATIWKGQQLNKDAMVEDGAYYALNGGIKPSGRTTEWNCEADTITVSEGGNSCGFVSYNRERFWCGGHCYALKNLAKDVDAHYLFHYLKGKQARVMVLRVGSGLPNIQKSDIEAFPVILPDLASQTAIARYLNALREEIDLLGQSVAAFKTQKRGLMQKLLPGQWRLPVHAEAS
jgi:type I restriction enzyme, S subunit